MSIIGLLQSEKGRTYIETGLIVLRENYAMWRRVFGNNSASAPREIAFARVVEHESVHFRQALTCSYVFGYANEYFAACMNALQSFKSAPQEDRKRFEALYREMRERRAKPGERVSFHELEEGTLMVPIDRADTLTPADIIEGMAVIGSFQMLNPRANHQDFLEYMGREHYDDSQPEYWNTYELVAGELGSEAAYEVLSPLSFAALQTTRPSTTFDNLLQKAKKARSRPRLVDQCRDVRRLFKFAGLELEQHFLFRLDGFGDRQRHPTLHPCARYAVERVGAEPLLRYVANPLDLCAAPAEHREGLQAPVIVMPSDQPGKVASLYNGRARNDPDFGALVIHFTALIGAAERLFFPTDSPYQFCIHQACPHFESALCFQYFTPPSVERGYEQCQFPRSFRINVDLAPNEAWEERGHQRKTVEELVAAFEQAGEASIAALAHREKLPIIEWLGEAGYADLQWKCDAVAQKTLRALQTKKMDHVVEAKMFLQAVVREVRKRANPVCDAGATG